MSFDSTKAVNKLIQQYLDEGAGIQTAHAKTLGVVEYLLKAAMTGKQEFVQEWYDELMEDIMRMEDEF